MEEDKTTPDFECNDESTSLDRARVINRVLYSVGPCHLENLFEYVADEEKDSIKQALEDLIGMRVLVRNQDSENKEKTIIQVPIAQYDRARALVKSAEGYDDQQLLLSIPPVVIGKWKTVIRLLEKDNAGEITHTIRGRVNWKCWRSTTFSIYSTGKSAFKDFDMTLSSLKINQKLKHSCLFNADKFKRYLIEFEPPVQPGDEFGYTISYTLKYTFNIEKDWYEHQLAHSENNYRLKIYFPEGVVIDKDKTKQESYIASSSGAIIPLKKHIRIGNNGTPTIYLKLDSVPQGATCKIKWFTTKE